MVAWPLSQILSEYHTDFQCRCREKLEELGDVAMDTKDYHEAVEYFSVILSLDPTDRVGILLKRCEARVLLQSWDEVLSDAAEVYIHFVRRCFRQCHSQSAGHQTRPVVSSRPRDERCCSTRQEGKILWLA